MHQISGDMWACIDECQCCYQTCVGTAMGKYPKQGGKHIELQHFRRMSA